MPNINFYSPQTGRRIKEDNSIVNTADMIEAIYNALVVNKNAGMQLSGSIVKDYDAVTPSDSEDLPKQAIGFYVGVSGDVTVVKPNGNTVTIPNVAAQTQYEFPCVRIKATGTTALNIVALYGA